MARTTPTPKLPKQNPWNDQSEEDDERPDDVRPLGRRIGSDRGVEHVVRQRDRGAHRDRVTREQAQLHAGHALREAIAAGQIDIYPEYTGNAAFFFNKADDPLWKDAAKELGVAAADIPASPSRGKKPRRLPWPGFQANGNRPSIAISMLSVTGMS